MDYLCQPALVNFLPALGVGEKTNEKRGRTDVPLGRLYKTNDWQSVKCSPFRVLPPAKVFLADAAMLPLPVRATLALAPSRP